MSRRVLVIALLLAVAFVVSASTEAPPPARVTISQLRAKIQDLRSDKADLQADKADLRVQVDAQNAVIGDQSTAILRLRAQLANQPDPLDVITARGPDGLWAAMLAIWRSFPVLDPGQICGYDKGSVPADGVGLTLTSFTFYRWSGC